MWNSWEAWLGFLQLVFRVASKLCDLFIMFTDKPWSGDGGRGCISGYWDSPQLSSLADLTAGVCSFCASCSGRSPREVPVLIMSECLQLWLATSYSLADHLQAQVYNWAQQLCAPSTFKAGSRVTNRGMQFLLGHERWLLYCCWVITSS